MVSSNTPAGTPAHDVSALPLIVTITSGKFSATGETPAAFVDLGRVIGRHLVNDLLAAVQRRDYVTAGELALVAGVGIAFSPTKAGAVTHILGVS